MTMQESINISTLRSLLGPNQDLLARLASALWARVGRPLESTQLTWVEKLVGAQGPELVWKALLECNAILGSSQKLQAIGVTEFLSRLLSAPKSSDQQFKFGGPRVVWTLPVTHKSHTVRGNSYRDSISELISQAKEELIFVSPFLDSPGICNFLSSLADALLRKVKVVILTHDALNLSSISSKAIEELRREAERIHGELAVYTADAGAGRDRLTHPLLHSKIVICDRVSVIIGSANLTSYALSTNLETGVVLGAAEAQEVRTIITDVLESEFVYDVFYIRPGLKV